MSAISIDNLGKRYSIGEPWQPAQVRELLAEPWKVFRRRSKGRELWALRNVTLDIPAGEIVGVVGRNGAGKSTMLKILSRITEPTEGTATLHGRLASLLEVGTGFHPELTGRENVFLNGTILGMTRAEIRRKFDEIVAFADIGPLLDTPVKRYSSGMFVRLAFAVAAHVDPDVLLVDEVLAVGDVAFQRKCLGKVESITREGRTVVIVSHNMAVISQLCQKVLWLDQGKMKAYGLAAGVVSEYLSHGLESNLSWAPRRDASDAFTFHEVRLHAPGADHDAFPSDADVHITFDFTVHRRMAPTRLTFNVLTESGTPILTSANTDAGEVLNQELPVGRQQLVATIPAHLLRPGRYVVSISEPDGEGHIVHEGALSFTITEQNSLAARDYRTALITPVLPWTSTSEYLGVPRSTSE
ncbi:MAG TPA: polysaccharide ABC transporter ATP-binding protein [Thermoanaerobaculia bacterium]|nr:polysaccharide ABC transporter ATP-binding protein [Thermoanaerobaculia bacterium]